MRFIVIILVSQFLSAAAASAEQFQITGKTLSIVPPEGYCAFDRDQPADAAVMNAVENAQAGHNQVLLQFAPCSELDDWRAGRIPVLSSMGNVTVQTRDGAPYSIPMPRADFIAGAEAHFGKPDFAEVERNLNTKIEGVRVSGMEMLGAIDSDASAFYFGVVGMVEAAGEKTPAITVGSMTLLGSFVSNIYLVADAAPGTLEKLLAIQKPYLAELVRLNP